MTQTTTVKPIKVYVAVKTDFTADGTMLPREITWEDGERFEIDRVLDIRQAAAMKAGGQGDRYTVRIRGKQRYLFFERSTNLTGNNIGRWFVERKITPPQPVGWVDYSDGSGGRIYSDGTVR
jgi:hypothetical protein